MPPGRTMHASDSSWHALLALAHGFGEYHAAALVVQYARLIEKSRRYADDVSARRAHSARARAHESLRAAAENDTVAVFADQPAYGLGLGVVACVQLTAGRAENADPHQSSRSSKASRPRLASGLLSPCFTKIIVTKLSATNSAA